MKKLRTLWRRSELDRDLEDELRFDLEMKGAEGGDPLEAHRSLGNATALKEACRELWTFSKLETWWQDICYAIRTLARTPGFTLVADGVGARNWSGYSRIYDRQRRLFLEPGALTASIA